MGTSISLTAALLCGALLTTPKNDRRWHDPKVREIQRTPNREGGDHWEYILVSDGLLYTLKNATKDSPYLNSSMNPQVKIASVLGNSGVCRPDPTFG